MTNTQTPAQTVTDERELDKLPLHRLPAGFNPYNLKRLVNAVWKAGDINLKFMQYVEAWEQDKKELEAARAMLCAQPQPVQELSDEQLDEAIEDAKVGWVDGTEYKFDLTELRKCIRELLTGKQS